MMIIGALYALYNVALAFSAYSYFGDDDLDMAFLIVLVVVALHFAVGGVKAIYLGPGRAMKERYDGMTTFRGATLLFSDVVAMPLAACLAALHVAEVAQGDDHARYGIALTAAAFGNILCLLDYAYGDNSSVSISLRRRTERAGDVV